MLEYCFQTQSMVALKHCLQIRVEFVKLKVNMIEISRITSNCLLCSYARHMVTTCLSRSNRVLGASQVWLNVVIRDVFSTAKL